MTEREIQKLFVDHPFGEAKRLLIEDIERSGYELTGNENVFELKAISTNCSRSQTNRNENVVIAEGGGNPESGGTGGGVGGGGAPEGQEEEQCELPKIPENELPHPFYITPNSIQIEPNSVQIEQSENPTNQESSEMRASEAFKEMFEGEQNNEQEQEPTEGQQQTQEQQQSQQQRKRRQRKSRPEQGQPELPQNQENGEQQNRKQEPESPKEKSEEEMEGEASELMKKAQELLKEAEKKREEKRRKEEEERRKREQETQKNNRHYMTDEVVKRLKCLGKAFLVGPAGTGKSTLAMCACREIFGIEGPVEAVVKSGKFAQISFSPDTVSADMLGFTDVNGVFHETEIIRVFRDGGLILFDEMDDADASLLVKLNTMLANRVIPIPGGVVTQNEECYIVGTANTYGKGGNSMYVGRSRLDAATLDRWKMSTIDVDYDVKLEEGIVARTIGENYPKAAKELTIATRVIRERIQANKWKQICSTRFVIDGCKMVAAGYSIRKVLDTYLLDWDDNSRRLVNSTIRDAFKEEGK